MGDADGAGSGGRGQSVHPQGTDGCAAGVGIPDVAVNNLMMRDDWIKRQMAKRISEFTDEKTLQYETRNCARQAF